MQSLEKDHSKGRGNRKIPKIGVKISDSSFWHMVFLGGAFFVFLFSFFLIPIISPHQPMKGNDSRLGYMARNRFPLVVRKKLELIFKFQVHRKETAKSWPRPPAGRDLAVRFHPSSCWAWGRRPGLSPAEDEISLLATWNLEAIDIFSKQKKRICPWRWLPNPFFSLLFIWFLEKKWFGRRDRHHGFYIPSLW